MIFFFSLEQFVCVWVCARFLGRPILCSLHGSLSPLAQNQFGAKCRPNVFVTATNWHNDRKWNDRENAMKNQTRAKQMPKDETMIPLRPQIIGIDCLLFGYLVNLTCVCVCISARQNCGHYVEIVIEMLALITLRSSPSCEPCVSLSNWF